MAGKLALPLENLYLFQAHFWKYCFLVAHLVFKEVPLLELPTGFFMFVHQLGNCESALWCPLISMLLAERVPCSHGNLGSDGEETGA